MKEIKLKTANVELRNKKDKEKSIIVIVGLLVVCLFFTILLVNISKKDSNTNSKSNIETVINNRVTWDKYTKVKTNMYYYEVRNIFGFDGELYSNSYGGYMVYRWKSEDGTKYVTVTFRDNKVYSKSQVGLN